MKDMKGNKLKTRVAWVQKIIVLCPKCGADCSKWPIPNQEDYSTVRCTRCEYSEIC